MADSNHTSLVPIAERDIDGHLVQTCSARDLHKFLSVGKDFSNWIKDQIQRARLVKNRDFVLLAEKGVNPQGGRPVLACYLTIEAGKHVAMLSQTEKGFEVREYFIECERRVQQHVLPQTFAQALRMLADKSEALEAARPAIEFVRNHVEVSVAAITFRDLAKKYKVSEPDFRSWLVEQRICFMQTIHCKRQMRPYKNIVMQGYAELKTEHSQLSGHPYEVVYFTSSGQVWLDTQWSKTRKAA